MQPAIPKSKNTLLYFAGNKVGLIVPYRKPGNVVAHVFVEFSIIRMGERYTVVPLCSEACKRLANLPDDFTFEVKDGQVCLQRKDLAAIANEIVGRLQRQKGFAALSRQ